LSSPRVRLPADERVELAAHRGVPLERDHLRGGAFARPRGHAGERSPRARDEPVVDDRDLRRDAEPVG